MHTVFMSLGSNKGNRLLYLKEALKEIKNKIGPITNESDIFETEAWSYKDHNYLNSVIVIETSLLVYDVLTVSQEIEKKLGRKKKPEKNEKNKAAYSSRIIDIDILFYGSEIIETEDLIIPHPRLHLRKFVLKPLNQIAPNFIHPLFNKKIKSLLKESSDKSKVKLYTEGL